MIPIEKITPGVYEARRVDGGPQVIEVTEQNGKLFCSTPGCEWEYLLADMSDYEFTARYVRCDAEPVECWATMLNGSPTYLNLSERDAIDHADDMTAVRKCPHSVRSGLFIPTGDAT